jgi:hypothetical protein
MSFSLEHLIRFYLLGFQLGFSGLSSDLGGTGQPRRLSTSEVVNLGGPANLGGRQPRRSC